VGLKPFKYTTVLKWEYMGFLYTGLHVKIALLNEKIRDALKSTNAKKLLEAERFIIDDPTFTRAIEKARDKLGITGIFPENKEYEYGNAFMDLSFLGDNVTYERLVQVATDTVEELNLPYGWSEYIEAYIVTNNAPINPVVSEDVKIDVEAIGYDGELNVTLYKGLKRTDFEKVWKVFEQHFNKYNVTDSKDDSLKRRIYLDRTKNSMSYGELANKYYPDELDHEASRDKIRKIINRIDSSPNSK